jgi:hypothetical protein
MYECEGFYDGTSACIIWKGFIRTKTWDIETIELAESIFDRRIKTRNIPSNRIAVSQQALNWHFLGLVFYREVEQAFATR